ncbi:MAG TPA: OmpA family protein [Candidatus Acidoferrales bacterium]|nr:OmpA family protein [Candidatus Acidoferrales bacterium]
MKIANAMFACLLGSAALCAPSAAQSQSQSNPQSNAPVISINIQRTIQTVDYHSKGSTRIDFRGTALMPYAKGVAKIEPKNGAIAISANLEGLTTATQFGSAYLTYVLWAITPEGRPNNLGEVVLDGGGSKGKVEVSTRLQNFGLIVTAEPFFAVSAPSQDVIMENVVRADTAGQVNTVNAQYDLLQRGRYDDAKLPALQTAGEPLSLLEARNAMRIAQWKQADKYAPEPWSRASDALARAEDLQTKKQSKAIPTVARDAIQAFEDSITISVRRQEDERLEAERKAAADREAAGKAAQDAAAKQKLEAELAAAKEAAARAQAEQAQAESEKQRLAAEAARAQADKQAAESEKQRLAAQSQAEAEAKARADAEAKSKEAQESAAAALAAAQRSELEKQQLRASLLEQFNRILETRDTPRGLVVNLGDVLFATAKFDLRPDARERLAKLSGIVLAHPGLSLSIEGYTDNVGGDAYNQTLSEQRATSVQSYLVSQGLDAASITAKGFGKSTPVADNSTAAGRQQNRRVEIVISGEVIGSKIGPSTKNP